MLQGLPQATGRRGACAEMPAQLTEAQGRRDARSATQRAEVEARDAWRCRSSCKAGLLEWILRPQPRHAVRRGQLTADRA